MLHTLSITIFSDRSDSSVANMLTWNGAKASSTMPLLVDILALIIGLTLQPTLNYNS